MDTPPFKTGDAIVFTHDFDVTEDLVLGDVVLAQVMEQQRIKVGVIARFHAVIENRFVLQRLSGSTEPELMEALALDAASMGTAQPSPLGERIRLRRYMAAEQEISSSEGLPPSSTADQIRQESRPQVRGVDDGARDPR
jgi:hypothetical protein